MLLIIRRQLERIRAFEIANFGRLSTQGATIHEIDGLRCFAFALVFLLHLSNYIIGKVYQISPADDAGRLHILEGNRLAQACSKGGFGVDVFFVISGFILVLPFAQAFRRERPPVSLSGYYLRRLTRLEPPYIINLTIILLISVVRSGKLRELMPQFGAAVFYVNNFVFHDYNRINPVQWSLEIEVQFYILAPFLSRLFKIEGDRKRAISLILLMLFTATLNQFVVPERIWSIPTERTLIGHLHFFLIGFVLANWYLGQKDMVVGGILWDLIGFVLWAAVFSGVLLVYCPAFLIPIPLLLACQAAFKSPRLNLFLCTPEVYLVGGMCYTFYLYHQFFLAALVPAFAPLHKSGWAFATHFTIEFLLATPIMLIGCSLLFVLFERPFMRRGWYTVFSRIREKVIR